MVSARKVTDLARESEHTLRSENKKGSMLQAAFVPYSTNRYVYYSFLLKFSHLSSLIFGVAFDLNYSCGEGVIWYFL